MTFSAISTTASEISTTFFATLRSYDGAGRTINDFQSLERRTARQSYHLVIFFFDGRTRLGVCRIHEILGLPGRACGTVYRMGDLVSRINFPHTTNVVGVAVKYSMVPFVT
jgi:hypothetical protein